jgi:hypothetical protein
LTTTTSSSFGEEAFGTDDKMRGKKEIVCEAGFILLELGCAKEFVMESQSAVHVHKSVCACCWCLGKVDDG